MMILAVTCMMSVVAGASGERPGETRIWGRGWMAAMLMYIMGASDAQVMTEYLKSSDAGYEVDKSWLNAALSAARKNNGGSIMNYITSPTKGLGVSTDTIAKLKTKLGP